MAPRWIHPLAASAALMATAAFAVPPNDECVNATPIRGEGTFSFDSRDATTGPGPYPLSCDESDVVADVWFCWENTCPDSIPAFVETCGGTTVDTVLRVYEGCHCEEAWKWDCGLDECGYQSRVDSLYSDAFGPPRKYLIRISTQVLRNNQPAGGTGTFTITCGVPTPAPCERSAASCRLGDGWAGLHSSGNEFIVADNFTPAIDGTIDEVCWWGGYFDGNADCAYTIEDAFEVRYYLDTDGIPGPLIAGPFSQMRSDLIVTGPVGTNSRIMDTVREYEYSARHEPVRVAAGECYWVEIRNEATGSCLWYWEGGLGGDDRSVQDGWRTGLPDGYDVTDVRTDDLAFCIDLPLEAKPACAPPAPSNDECASSIKLSDGIWFIDTTAATTDGPVQDCRGYYPGTCCDFPLGDEIVHKDVWYDYHAACPGKASIRLCDSIFDTKVAVYEGSDCPESGPAMACNDDSCEGPETIAGGAGSDGAAAGTADEADCFTSHPTRGCDNPDCQSRVCLVEADCCSLAWSLSCAQRAELMCRDCFTPHNSPGCDSAECEARVCAASSYCCDSLWYNSCAQQAAVLCNDIRVPGLRSEVTWPVASGNAYKIRIGGYRDGAGPAVLEVSLGPVVPKRATLVDFAALANCFSGDCGSPPCPPVGNPATCCRVQDFDRDGDVDLADYEVIFGAWFGPDHSASSGVSWPVVEGPPPLPPVVSQDAAR